MKKYSIFVHAIALLSTVLFMALQFYDPASVREHIEAKTLDLRQYIRNVLIAPQRADNIVIVTVDERSIAAIGRWPWSRTKLAELIDVISSGEPKVVGVDILLSESEGPKQDEALGKAIENAGNVVLATVFLTLTDTGGKVTKEKPDYLWEQAFMDVKSTQDIPWKNWMFSADSVLAPVDAIARGAQIGSVFTQPDRDGVLRWEVLALQYDGDFYPSMPLQVARIAKGLKMEDMSLLGGSGVMLGKERVDTDLSSRILLNYRGGTGSFKYISATDLLSGTVKPDVLKDKIVLLGTSAIATYDQKVTPLSANMPGVEKNATVVDNILALSYLRRSPGLIEMAFTLITALALTVAFQRLQALGGALLAVELVIGYCVFAFYMLASKNMWINITYPIANMIVIFTAQGTARFFLEEMKARQIRHMFSSYVSAKVVEALIENPEKARLGGERKEVTVMFSDVAGFTSISEKLQPEEVVSLLNEYFKTMTDVIFRWDGTFDKIVGDEIMAFWGAPVDQPDHPELAVRCALDMLNKLEALREKWRSEGKPLIDMGIGLNTGVVLVGNIGAEDKKMDYTIMGDHVNAGARVEALTRKYNAKLLITHFTYERIKEHIASGRIGHVNVEFKDDVKVKGKEISLGVYELTDTEATWDHTFDGTGKPKPKTDQHTH